LKAGSTSTSSRGEHEALDKLIAGKTLRQPLPSLPPLASLAIEEDLRRHLAALSAHPDFEHIAHEATKHLLHAQAQIEAQALKSTVRRPPIQSDPPGPIALDLTELMVDLDSIIRTRIDQP
jgi:hypothetical protein